MLRARIQKLWADDQPRALVLAGLFGMVALNQLGTGVLTAVIPVKLAADGYSAATAGTISTVFSLCFLVGCVIGPGIAGRLGPSGTLLAAGALHCALALLHWYFPGPVVWALLRGVGGLVTATYFILVETWVAAQATTATRGLVFGLYMVVVRLAFALGQVSLAFVAPEAIGQLFLVAALAYMVAPQLRPRTHGALPPMRRPSLASVLELPRRVPAAAAAALAHGCVFGSVPGLLPKWGLEAGLSVDTVAAALLMIQLGGLVLQLPVSFASDRFERRTVMAIAAAATAVVSLLVQAVPAGAPVVWLALVLLWGGLASSLYSVGSAHANDLAPHDKRVAWVSAIMLIWGIGAAVGPLVASLLMDTVGVSTLWLYAAAVSAANALFLVWRKIVRR